MKRPNIMWKYTQNKLKLTVVFDYFRYDPKDLDILLSEVVLLNTRAELYLRFIKRRSAVSLIKNKNLTQIRNGMDLF